MKTKIFARNTGVVLASFLAAAAASAAEGAPASVSDLATGISFSDVGLAILAVAGALVTLAVLKKGARQVLSFIGR